MVCEGKVVGFEVNMVSDQQSDMFFRQDNSVDCRQEEQDCCNLMVSVQMWSMIDFYIIKKDCLKLQKAKVKTDIFGEE